MSLLDDFAHPCTLLEKTRIYGDEGGWTTEWTDGETFQNYQARDTTMEARRAEQEGVSSVYSVLVDQSVPIEYNDYFRDDTTGVTYRVTSDPDDKMSPASATFSLKYFTAERKVPPT